MSEALDDSGAGRDTVIERRGTYLWREGMEMIQAQLKGQHIECFRFGSQSEGTTTPGLQSDIDVLCSQHIVNIVRVCGDWEAGITNYMMLHAEITPPQQFLLQVIRKDTPEPESSLRGDADVKKDSEQVLVSAERWKKEIEYKGKNIGEAIRNGPSVSFVPKWDLVNAFHVRKPFPEIQIAIQ